MPRYDFGMRLKLLVNVILIIGISSAIAYAAPEIRGHQALEADGVKYIKRVQIGLRQYDPNFLSLEPGNISAVNTTINNLIKYTPDENLYGTPDHWANFEELSNSLAGDCEDFALLKYWALRKLGVPAASMHVLIYYDKILRLHHAVLVVNQLVLDNRIDKIIPLEKVTDITPNMAINENEFFIYGKSSVGQNKATP